MNDYGFEKMKRDYLERQKEPNQNPFLFLIVAILMIVGGFVFNNYTQDRIKDFKTATGIAYYERDSLKSSAGSTYYNVYVKYTINGKEYYEYLRNEQGGLTNKNGKQVTFYYNPNNPSEIVDKSSSIIGPFFIGFGIVILLAFIGDFTYRKIKGFKMDDPTPNYMAAEKVANFVEDLNNETGFYNKFVTAQKAASKIKRIGNIIACILIILIGIFVADGGQFFYRIHNCSSWFNFSYC